MSFPKKIPSNHKDYFNEYRNEAAKAFDSIDSSQFEKAATVIFEAIKNGATIFSCGNGGSASIANHLKCDFMKGIRTNTQLIPNVVSLSTNIEIITAISNDISYDEIFSYQLAGIINENDILITISSSGNSNNIIKAIEESEKVGCTVISLTGFEGGESSRMADINLHVESSNYGITEDCHQSIMHSLAQSIRIMNLQEEDVSSIAF